MHMSFFVVEATDGSSAQSPSSFKITRRASDAKIDANDKTAADKRPRTMISFEEPQPGAVRRQSILRNSSSSHQQQMAVSSGGPSGDLSFNNLVTSYTPNKTLGFDELQRRMNEESMLSLKTALVNPESLMVDANATEASAARQQFLLDQRRTQRACHWQVIMQVSRFLNTTIHGLNVTKAQSNARDQMNPRCLLGIRRAIRRVRLRMQSPSMTKPTVASVRNDKLLGLFSEAHIQYLVDNLVPRYFFAREGIIFMGSEDDECYVLSRGSADVMMGKIRVFTMTAGMSFGSVGMISGEPRTATIMARENCLVWSISRSVFEAYGTRDHQVAAAQAIIRELRQKNIRSVYKSLIDPDYLLSRFVMLKGCSHEGISMLLAKSEPRVLKAGEVLIQPPPADSELFGRQRRSPYELCPNDDDDGAELPTDMDVLYILRGTIRIYRTASGPLSQEKCLEEHLTFMMELVTKRTLGSDDDTISMAAKSYAASTQRGGGDCLSASVRSKKSTCGAQGGREVICDMSGPLLLNIAPLVLGEPSPLLIETLGGCDVLVLTNTNFHRLGASDLATLRQNALNIHCPFVKPLARTPILRTIFQSSLSFDFLSKLQTAQIHQEPYVFSPGSRLTYGGECGNDVFGGAAAGLFPAVHHRDTYTAALILRGEIKTSKEARGGATGHPLLWPDVTLMIFGCEPCEAVCLTRVEAILLRRADVIESLLVALNEMQLSTLCSALTNAFVSRVGRRPTMELTGVHPSKGTTQGRWKHLVSSSKEMSRASRPVHVVHPPTKAVAGGLGFHRREVSFAPQSFGKGGADDGATESQEKPERQRSTVWDTQDTPVAQSSFHSTSGGQDDDYDDDMTPRNATRYGSGDFLVEGRREPSMRFGKKASRVFTAPQNDPILCAALASLEEYRQHRDDGNDGEEYVGSSADGLHRPVSSPARHRRSPQQRRAHVIPPAVRPASARARVNNHLAPRARVNVSGVLRSGGGYPTGLTVQKAGSDSLTMRHSAPTVGVSDVQKLHRTLEEFFS